MNDDELRQVLEDADLSLEIVDITGSYVKYKIKINGVYFDENADYREWIEEILAKSGSSATANNYINRDESNAKP